MKVTVSDNLIVGAGVNGGNGFYEVRMNGGSMMPACQQRENNWNAGGWANIYAFPFATICLTDKLPAGLYEFETWVYSISGQAEVGANAPQALVFVEEIPLTTNYGFSNTGSVFWTFSTTFQRAPGRTVTFTKKAKDTLLRLTLADTFRAGVHQNGADGTVMVRIDDLDTTCYTSKYDAQGAGGNFHDPFVMTCVLSGVTAGPHTFSVWIRADSGGETYLGWERSYPLLMVEEVAPQNITYNNNSSVSGELGGDWAGVSGRWLLHSVSAAGKTLRVTYSDTFRSAVNCNGHWGLYQLYVDNQPTNCINGQHAYNSGSSAQNHHHPVHQVCLVKNLSPGPHIFSIYSTTRQPWDGKTCGTNYFGRRQGQPLLMLEELP